jgi:hypothetical protein
MNLFLNTLVAGADLASLAIYAALMAFLIGGILFASLRDEANSVDKAKRCASASRNQRGLDSLNRCKTTKSALELRLDLLSRDRARHAHYSPIPALPARGR